ncbi:MAG: CehA/McbA family metallohydrolase [Gemmatimonadaceae bacterium]
MHLTTVLTLASVVAASVQAQQPNPRWFRGNTHAHTFNSDGDSSPDVVALWYRQNGYHFTFITDHEYVTDVAPLNAMFGRAGRFLILSAQEVTQQVRDSTHPQGIRQAHVNALGVTRVVRPLGERNVANEPLAATYARNLGEIRRAGGVAQVNHPNFRWSVRLQDLLELPDSTLLEIANAHTLVNNLGGADSAGRWAPSTEALWDSLLARGKLVFGVADDDSHSFRPESADLPDATRPGRAWIWVRADTLTADAILRAIGRGDFYSSTGVTLRDYQADAREVRLEVAPSSDRRVTIEFIGNGGRVLSTVSGHSARYRMTGTEGYVRARVTDSSGRHAWTQPVRVRR